MSYFKDFLNFISCILHENCEYSIKKILAYTFTGLILYLAIFTDKNYYELLLFVGGLLGVRAFERVKLWNKPSEEVEEPEDTPGLSVDMKLGSNKKGPSKKRLLTD